MKVICTNSEGKYQEIEGGLFNSKSISSVRDCIRPGSVESIPVIKLNPEKKYQQILGFGAAFTDAACYLINQLDKDVKESFLENLYSPSGMALNVGRTTVAQCDYGRINYSYNDTPDDIEMKNFSIDYDREYIIPTIKKALEINPDLFLLSSTWSPPGWMKTGGLMTGGWMRQSYLEAYANYYLRYLQEYAKEGIKIHALTPQNEAETDQLCLMPACYWHPEMEMSFARDYLVPLLKKNGMDDIEVWIMDHNYIMWRRAKWMLDDPSVKEVVKGVAFHPYEGTADAMSIVHDAHPEVDIHMTEVGTSRVKDYFNGWCGWGNIFTEMMRNWSRTILCWNIALNEYGKPNVGPMCTKGFTTINSKTREISYSAQFWTLGQFSKFVKRGAFRIESESYSKAVNHVAFKNPDGEYVVVVTNPGPSVEVTIDVEDRYAVVVIPENSVCTLTFK